MAAVNFPCSQCKKLIAVDSAYQGKAVRCPHCKAVVTAATAAPVQASVPARGPVKDEPDSIFGEHVDEDLFGASPKPVVQIPPAPPPPPGLEPTVFQPPAAPASAGLQTLPVLPDPDRGGRQSLLLLAAIVILVPYAIFVTGLALYLFVNRGSQPHPFEMLPDDGDPKSKRGATSKRIKPTEPLPEKLVIGLNQTLTIGDLQVTPRQVEQKNVVFRSRSGHHPPTTASEQSLVLHLELKNISRDIWFRPTDPKFDYLWKANDPRYPVNTLPYTHLEVNGSYYCSPFAFHTDPRLRLRPQGDNLQDEFVEGQDDDGRILGPGETARTVICTDPKDQVPALLASHNGKLLWRVQLRRGLVKHQEVERSRTAVIGVAFAKEQIVKK